MPSTPKKSIRTSQIKKIPLKWLGITLLALLLAGQLYYDVLLYKAHTTSDNSVITGYIIDSIHASNKPAVLEPVSKKVYLPEANLVLPYYPPTIGQVRYTYSPAIDGTDAEADVTTNEAMEMGIGKLRIAGNAGSNKWTSNPSDVFDLVPNAQVCARGLHLVFGEKTHYDNLKFVKQLADGRTMKVYAERQDCSLSLDPLVAYLKDAQSY